MPTQSFIVTAGRYSARCEVLPPLTRDAEPEVLAIRQFIHHRPGFLSAEVAKRTVPVYVIARLETAAIKAFWELGDPHDDTAIDRAEYRQGARR
jgi:hypothetical protein